MYRTIRKITFFAAFLAGLCSCDLAEVGTTDSGMVTFSMQVCSEETVKSSYTVGESAVNDFKVFVYQSGTLVDSGYSDDGGALSFTLSAGSYDFYALCNAGDVSSLGSSPDSYRHSAASASSLLSGGIPMAGKSTAVSVTASTSSVTVDVTRLVAKYSLYVQRNFEDTGSTFTVTGVRVCQAAGDALAFGSNSTPNSVLGVSAGDYASPADLASLNTDVTYNSTTGAVSFYMLENARGTLLSGNTDPWLKCYDSYGGLLSSSDAAACTYLEVTGVWASTGVSETVTYRMFLGADNCTNFDVVRNTQSNVTLILTDTGKERESWKVEDATDSDTRSLAWSRSSTVVSRPASGTATGTVTLTVSPSGMYHSVWYSSSTSSPSWQKMTTTATDHVGYTDATNAVTLDYNRSTRQLTVTATPSTTLFSFLVKAQTSDGKASSVCTVEIDDFGLIIN